VWGDVAVRFRPSKKEAWREIVSFSLAGLTKKGEICHLFDRKEKKGKKKSCQEFIWLEDHGL